MTSLTASLGNLVAAIYQQHEGIESLMVALVWIALAACVIYMIWYFVDAVLDQIACYRAEDKAERDWPTRSELETMRQQTPLTFNRANYHASKPKAGEKAAFRFPTDQGVA